MSTSRRKAILIRLNVSSSYHTNMSYENDKPKIDRQADRQDSQVDR